METFAYERPAALPAALAPLSAVPVALTDALPSVPQAHQIQAQAELILTVAPNGVEESSGFTGKGIQVALKRLDVRGVPPRGRPV